MPAEKSGERRKLETFTAKELLQGEFPEVFFVVNDMLPAGSAILAAPAKTGKSWMMLQLAIAAASGGYFMGRKSKEDECRTLLGTRGQQTTP
ncbi:MAG: AAA family ATPase [Clostridia bacterium]